MPVKATQTARTLQTAMKDAILSHTESQHPEPSAEFTHPIKKGGSELRQNSTTSAQKRRIAHRICLYRRPEGEKDKQGNERPDSHEGEGKKGRPQCRMIRRCRPIVQLRSIWIFRFEVFSVLMFEIWY